MNSTAIRNVRIFTGFQVVERGSVLIVDGLIMEVTSDPDRQFEVAGAGVVEGAGKTLLPGLIDAHVHASPGDLERALRFGVTTELDLHSSPQNLTELRATAASRDDVADVRSAGIGATAPGGHPLHMTGGSGVPTVTGPQDAADFVAGRLYDGSDYIKVFIEDGSQFGVPMPTLDAPTITALVEAAHAAGKFVVAHTLTRDGAHVAVTAGVDGLAHAFDDVVADDDFIQCAVNQGTFLISTLALLEATTGTGDGVELVHDVRIAPGLTEGQRAAVGRPVPWMDKQPDGYSEALATVGRLARAGVPILAGTDANGDNLHGAFPVVHGASLHRELVCLVQAGLSPQQALAAATSVPARHFRLSDRGRIEPGLRADLLLVDGDPTTDITATRSIVGVWRGGTRLAGQAAGV
jgi:imidazolonepropionase-like amidohydrolase